MAIGEPGKGSTDWSHWTVACRGLWWDSGTAVWRLVAQGMSQHSLPMRGPSVPCLRSS